MKDDYYVSHIVVPTDLFFNKLKNIIVKVGPLEWKYKNDIISLEEIPNEVREKLKREHYLYYIKQYSHMNYDKKDIDDVLKYSIFNNNIFKIYYAKLNGKYIKHIYSIYPNDSSDKQLWSISNSDTEDEIKFNLFLLIKILNNANLI